MTEMLDLSKSKLAVEEREGVATFCKRMGDVLGDAFVSIGIYGSAVRDDYHPGRSDINLLVVTGRIDLKVLKAVLAHVEDGRRFGIAPLFLTEQDLRTLSSSFPIKFLSIKEDHRVLLGKDVVAGLDIEKDHLCLRAKQEFGNQLMRFRANYLVRGGRRLTAMMARMSGGFFENLRVLVYMRTGRMPRREDVVEAASKSLDLDIGLLRRIQALKGQETTLPHEEAESIFSDYLAILGRLLVEMDRGIE